ncbi:hypothetical protein BJV82DRAFT_664816 [Fennellomyces sp. T-0311]|nr:hypothetical protein BJV82DRAFT_664816 [Fennellomyces sp. T-0311]
MPKERRTQKKSQKPYDRDNKTNEPKRSKLNPKKIKLKNEELTDKLDNLMTDLTSHLNPAKKKKSEAQQGNLASKSLEQVQAAQREYEKVNHDMEDAMGLLTRL